METIGRLNKIATVAGLLSNQGEKCKLLFHNGSLKKKSIQVWYSKAQVIATHTSDYLKYLTPYVSHKTKREPSFRTWALGPISDRTGTLYMMVQGNS